MSEIDLSNYIPDYLKDYYDSIQNLFPVCLLCKKPVFIKNIIDNKIVKVEITCDYCNNKESLPVDDYIEKLKLLLPEKNYCVNHSSQLSYGFCENCDKWFCRECLIDHLSENHALYLSQFKIHPICNTHPTEKASFFDKTNGNYLCNKCDFKSKLAHLENNFYNNGQDDSIMGHCFRCLHYDFVADSAFKLIFRLQSEIHDIFKDKDDKKLAEEKEKKLIDANKILGENLIKVRHSNILIANGFLKKMPVYHIFMNIKNNMGENHATFWSFEDLKSIYEDNYKKMTKEIAIDLIDKIYDICNNNLTTTKHQKLSIENDFNFIEEKDMRIKELKTVNIDFEDIIRGIFILEEKEKFLIYDRYQFQIFNAKNYNLIQTKVYNIGYIAYISVIDNKKFLVGVKDSYELYELKTEGKYEMVKSVTLEKIPIEKKEKEKKEEKEEKDEKEKEKKEDEKKDDFDDDDDDSDLNNSENSEKDKNDMNKDISSLVLLPDGKTLAVGQSSSISLREFETGKLIKILEKKHEGSVDIIFCLNEYLNNYLVSCCSCNKLCLWDLESYEHQYTFDAEINSPTSYCIINDDILITGGYMIGYKLNIEMLEKEGDFSGDFCLLNTFLKLNDEEVLFATNDEGNHTNNFYILDIDTLEYKLHMKNIHNDLCAGCIKISENKFITASRDNAFKVWEIKE